MNKSNENTSPFEEDNRLVYWKEVAKEELELLIESGNIEEFSKDCLLGFRIVKKNDASTKK